MIPGKLETANIAFHIMTECNKAKRLTWLDKVHRRFWVWNTDVLSKFSVNPFRPEFTIVILIHYKPQIAVAIRDL